MGPISNAQMWVNFQTLKVLVVTTATSITTSTPTTSAT